jgi:AbrB family looped-hinge helix DNA binding protein
MVVAYPNKSFLLLSYVTVAILRNYVYTGITTNIWSELNMSKTHIPSNKIFVQKRNLISLPRDIRESLDINEGDVLDISIVDNKIIIEPMKLVPSSQAYFWTEKTQKDMIEANNEVNSGNIREFKNIKDFLEGLEQ